MKHTPGPWTVAPGRDKTHPHNIESRSPECDGFDLARCVLIDDARLIAAAPDLLAALRGMVALFDQGTNVAGTAERFTRYETAIAAASAAIAKAINPEN